MTDRSDTDSKGHCKWVFLGTASALKSKGERDKNLTGATTELVELQKNSLLCYNCTQTEPYKALRFLKCSEGQ